MATSYANGGQLSASNSEAWNSWSNTFYGKKFISTNSSVILNPKPTLSKITWLMNFISAIKDKNKITQDICKMAIDSINLYKQIAKRKNQI